MIGRETRNARRKPASVPSFSTSNPTDLSAGSNPGRHGGKQATIHLSSDTTLA
jgi:hypothetical protein